MSQSRYNNVLWKKLAVKLQILITLFLICIATAVQAQEKITLGLTGVTLKEDVATIIRFKKYLTTKTGIAFELKFAKSYSVVENRISRETIDLAYVCGLTYVNIKKNGDGELLAIPVVENKTTYSSYIITKKTAPYKNLLELKQRNFAMSDPGSNSGALVPTYELLLHGYDKDKFFKKIIFTYDHGESIHAVQSGFVDGASVDSIVYNAYMRKNPKAKEELKIIDSFDDYPITPFVVRKNFPQHLKEKVQKVLLEMDKDSAGQKILQAMAIDKFIKPDDISYQKIKTIQDFIAKMKK